MQYKVNWRSFSGVVDAYNYSSAVKQFIYVVSNYHDLLHVPGIGEFLEREFGTRIDAVRGVA